MEIKVRTKEQQAIDNLKAIVNSKDKIIEIEPPIEDTAQILLDIITNLEKKIEYNDLVLKALHRYFTEHECYEAHEFLRQLESCTENDLVWLKRMAGDNNE